MAYNVINYYCINLLLKLHSYCSIKIMMSYFQGPIAVPITAHLPSDSEEDPTYVPVTDKDISASNRESNGQPQKKKNENVIPQILHYFDSSKPVWTFYNSPCSA